MNLRNRIDPDKGPPDNPAAQETEVPAAQTARQLTDVEQRLVEHVRAGTLLKLDPSLPTDKRTIRADVIRDILRGRYPLDPDPRGLRITGAHIPDRLDLDYLSTTLPLWLDRTELPRGVTAFEAYLGTFSLEGSTLGAPSKPDSAEIPIPPGSLVRLNLSGTHLRGTLLAAGLTVHGEFRAHSLTTDGLVSLNGATLSNPGGTALTLDGATIKGSLFASNGFTTIGQVCARGMTVDGQISLEGATLSNPGGTALTLDRTTVKADLFASNGFTTTGQVRALGMTVDGQICLDGATLSNPGGHALALDGATIKGDFIASEDFTVTGEVRALGMTVGGSITLSGATLSNPGGNALCFDRATIKGNLFVDEGFTATGQVRAPAIAVSGHVIFDGATLSDPGGYALWLEAGDLGSLFLRETKSEGSWNLTACQIGDLVFADEPERLPTFESVQGWRVRDVHGFLREDRAAMTALLDATARFTASTWEEIARLYDRNGQPSDARRVRYAAARRTARHSPWPGRLIRSLYGATVGHGYYPLLAAGWLLVLVVCATVLTATHREAFLPTNLTAARQAVSTLNVINGCPDPGQIFTAAADSQCLTPGYPELKPFTYALTTVSPASALTTPAWAPQAPGAAWLETTLTILKTFGWLLTALLLAGITGLLRKV